MNYKQYRARPHFAELDGLRALAILGVLFAHMPGEVWRYFAGYLGVDAFFVISGFLITTLALREEETRGRLDVRAFFIRRSFRLFPAYYLTLALYAVLLLVLGFTPERREHFVTWLPAYLFYFQEVPFFTLPSTSYPFFHSWSLGIEEKFYVVWPFLAFVLLRGRAYARPWVALAGALLCSAATAIHPAGEFVFPYGAILAGCLVALLLQEQRSFDRVRVLGRPAVVGGLALAWLAIHVAVAAGFSAARPFYALVVAVFLAGAVTTEGRIRGALSVKPLTKVGTLSYGVYLLHLLVRNVVEKVIPPQQDGAAAQLATFALTVALSLVAAEVMMRLVERPMRDYGRRLSARVQRREAPPVQVPASLAVS
jgi:peptidoglycan/LPS O-acetylase OafA/YrhL